MTDTPTEGGGEGTWAKLRRRKVVQWGIAYAAGAWGFLQGLEYVSESFQWPNQLRQVALLALLTGLPIVLVLAWYHGDRGEQRVKGSELAIITLLFLLGGGIFWRYQQASEGSTAAAVKGDETKITTSTIDTRPSIAVLPFENRSDQSTDAYFVDGIHDDILTQLTKIGAMKVIARTSVEQFRGTRLTTKEIAGKLGVTKVLEGGVQRAGDRVRISVQLIDANSDTHLWAENYDRKLTAANIFAIQSEVAAAIAGALKATLTPGEKARVDTIPTENLEAWEAYQLGKQRMARRSSESLADAETFFRKAIHLDATFALAYVGLADTLGLQVSYSGKPEETTLAEADRVAGKALELDPHLAEAWASKGGIAMTRGRLTDAERLLRRAIELNPNYVTAHHWMSFVLRIGSDRFQEEYEHAERAAELDPLSSIINTNLADSLARLGRFDEAGRRHRRAIEIDPMSPVSYAQLARLDGYARNRFVEAVLVMERAVALDPGTPTAVCTLASLRFDLTDAPAAVRLISAATQRWPDDVSINTCASLLHSVLGDNAAAEQRAHKALAVFPQDDWALAILRDLDLRRGNAKASRARYASAYPELLNSVTPKVVAANYRAAIDLALVLQKTGEPDRGEALLDGSERAIRSTARLGENGYGIADAQIHALRGDTTKALAALREAEKAGWRGPFWRRYRDVDPNLASIRHEPEFKAVFADIERGMARQRAELAARPKDAPLDLATGN